jgi:uncharacterized damage-inducible protein DinB
MANFEDIVDGIRYDAWANKRWLECLGSKGFPKPDADILQHMLSASELWCQRCAGSSPTQFPVVEFSSEAIDAAAERWIGLMTSEAEDRVVEYTRTTGEPMSSKLSQIALHVINHGTYHRGELRGLCRSRDDADYPETDRILFTAITGN